MTPLGGVSALSRREATALIDRLAGKRPRYRQRGTVTAKQVAMMHHMAELTHLHGEALSNWLGSRFKVRSIEDVRDARLASKIIGGLCCMHRNMAGVDDAGKAPSGGNRIRRKAEGS